MSLPVRKAEYFIADFDEKFRWYDREAGWETAQRFLSAVDATLEKLGKLPELGRIRDFRHPSLSGLRSFRVEPPFNRWLIFYRITGVVIEAFRLIHGARDLPRRLLEPPSPAED